MLNKGAAAILCTVGIAGLAGMTPALAAGERYTIDPHHTFPSLEFTHMGISIWRGKFDRTRGTITLDRVAHTGTVDVAIDTGSINFGLDAMDVRARSDSYFKVDRFPTATYKGKVTFTGDRPSGVDGELTLLGVTRPVPLKFDLFGCINRPGPGPARQVCGADATGTLHWSDFGIPKSPDGTDEVHLHIQVEAEKD